MPAAKLAAMTAPEYPYPGLRPFDTDEAFLFRGRQAHTAELLRRLAASRFLAVVGTSGSGKSSLVRAGLLPALYRGYLVETTSRWRIAVMRPGSAPMTNLAEALASQNFTPADGQPLERLVSRSSRGLAELIRQAHLPDGESVLIVVDQFEELFRFQNERRLEDGGAEASLFVASLLDAAEAFDVRVYVVITMRTEFLGDCTQFPGLAEALNQSQYLVPRLTREQRREAIEGPVRLVSAQMSPQLVQRLLTELGDDPDQLPVLQHALNRTFYYWKQSGGTGEIDFRHYERAGTLRDALNDHADALELELPEPIRRWVAKVFRCLVTMEGGIAVRRPCNLQRIYDVSGAKSNEDRSAIQQVIRKYSAPENSLVFSTSGSDLRPESVIDISHESLIRTWRQLRGWLDEEVKANGWYNSVAEDVVRYNNAEASTWRDPELGRALAMLNGGPWNELWAQRSSPACPATFAQVRDFLTKSQAEQKREHRRSQMGRAVLVGLLVLLTIVLATLNRSLNEREKARDALAKATLAETVAHEEAAKANAQLKANESAVKQLQDKLSEFSGTEQERKRLVQQLRMTQAETAKYVSITQSLAEQAKKEGAARLQIQQSANLHDDDYSTAQRRITQLEQDLKDTQHERDYLKNQVHNYTGVNAK